MANDVNVFFAQGMSCAKKKSPYKHKRPVQQFSSGDPQEVDAMDILRPLLITTKRNQYVIVMSHRYSK